MDCNKDDAFKAKEIAEKKFVEMDIAAASKFALKAHNLYPSLDGLPQFIDTLNVYLSAEKRIDGCIDWYRVLGVDPLANEETIRKHFRKLALILHPDKNKSIGADGAFKIVSEAWSFLSDKTKRAMFDQKRILRGMHMKPTEIRPSVPAVWNGFHNLPTTNNLNRWNWRSHNELKSHPAPHPVKHTFWTVCNSCKVHFEYLRAYLNQNLICSNCRISFLAVEDPTPPLNVNRSSSPWNFNMQKQNPSAYNHMKKPYNVEKTEISARDGGSTRFRSTESLHKSFQSGAIFKQVATESMQASTSVAAEASSFFKPASADMKVGHKDGLSTAVKEEYFLKESHDTKKMDAGLASMSFNSESCFIRKENRPKKRRRTTGHKVQDNNSRDFSRQIKMEKAGIVEESSGSQKYSFEGRRKSFIGKFGSTSTRELTQLELRKMLMDKARNEICKKLNEWKAAASSTILQNKMTNKKDVEDKEGKRVVLNGTEATKSDVLGSKYEMQTKYSLPPSSGEDSDTVDSDIFSMSVPDPDFHDFDKDRTEKSFGNNQVWAVYDDDDGMPRYYAMVHKVISLKPFKLQISWLNSKSNNELAPLKWIGCGFPKTSGDFWIGKHEVNSFLNSFSHKVKLIKSQRGAIRIFPRKGDVWALYRNWSPDWHELTPDAVIHKYDMVEVLEDYNEEKGVTVVPLVKVVSFKTVFQQHSDPSKIRNVPREEMFRFSHQVPSYLLTGLEGKNAPAGCWELDPASTPLELLHVAKETEKEPEEVVKISERADDRDPLGGLKSAKEANLAENVETAVEAHKIEDEVKVKEDLMMHNGNKSTVPKMIVYSRKRFRGKLPMGAELSAH